MSDLFSAFNQNDGSENNKNNKQAKKKTARADKYTASDIEVLEGLEPVRKRPGMYIGGTDQAAMHHLVSEILDNCMDEAVAGYADTIEIELNSNSSITIKDNGRGIPVEAHPKFPEKSALEVIFTTLHAGGKFSSNAYQTAGGLHGVGISVVNALASELIVEVIRDKTLYRQSFARGAPQSQLENLGKTNKKNGTKITFTPDEEIFTDGSNFSADKVFEMARSKAYLFKGVKVKWWCNQEVFKDNSVAPIESLIHFPEGLKDYISEAISSEETIIPEIFAGEKYIEEHGIKIEWAISWWDKEGFLKSYCNTIPTIRGGSHEQGFKNAMRSAVKSYGNMVSAKKVQNITTEDIFGGACCAISVFMPDPVFQGQTKEKLVTPALQKKLEAVIKDLLEHWLSANTDYADQLLEFFVNNAEERLSKKANKEVSRKTAVQKLRLPGKLADCSKEAAEDTELFLVEGDSAGGSAKQARERETQAVLPLRGKILNVANSTMEKINKNREINDIEVALACGSRSNFDINKLRYERIIIMTDADVDGAHIASLLMTYFYLMMPGLIKAGNLYLANPPLYRVTQSDKVYYARDEEEREKLQKQLAKKSRAKIEVSRFKGLGEMSLQQLKKTTMSPATRSLTKLVLTGSEDEIFEHVDNLMGKRPEKRFEFIQSQALNNIELVKEELDI
jgi:topoisomerase-4 subunit B